MEPAELIAIFEQIAREIGVAVKALTPQERRARTERPGQYALDLVADAIALRILKDVPVMIVSEESGMSGKADARIAVVVDPVDGSTNCAHDLAYWATSLCALDSDGMLAALVANHATGEVLHRDSRRWRVPRRPAAAPVVGAQGRERDGGAVRLARAAAAVAAVPRARLRVARAVQRSRPAVSTATSTAARGTRRGTTSAVCSSVAKRARRSSTSTTRSS